MKDIILKKLKVLIDFLLLRHRKRLPKTQINLPYNSLSPTNNAEKVDDYLNALEWALNERGRIKNIAIAGPYGSGKSSIIKTFQEKHKHNYNFLNISLATFKEEAENEAPDKKEKNNLLRLIELSILQQLFYHEKDTKIPDSRFKKIKSQTNTSLWLITISLFIFTISFLHLVAPDFLARFSLLELTSENSAFFHYVSVLIVAVGILWMAFKSIRTLIGLSVKKLGISNASIEIDDKISKSILNNHIDEILYFFEVTEYNTVFIEDLDRFEQTDVFTKLREINLLINNSKKIENEVVFIYAIRDDMFQDKDRTKFFDFMIPIIPIINSSNSNDKLLKLVQQNKYNISEDLLDDISLFIDDMRLLYNVINEYYIYSKKLNISLDQDKLLSMIVYKNIYPNDFTKLSQNDGELYNTIINKHQYIIEKVSEIDDEILEVKTRIETYESNKISNLIELRTIYLFKIIARIQQAKPNSPFLCFWLNNQVVSMSQATEEENFDLIINSKRINYTYNTNISYRSYYDINFSSIEEEVDSELTFKEREDLILNKNKIEELKNKLGDLENKKNEIKKSKLKDLISNSNIIIDTESQKQKELINLLLRNGYIDEDYLDYISIFYEGSLSKNDHQFLINVKTEKSSEFDYPLQKKENLIKKINKFEFEKQYILNYGLLDFLIESSNYSDVEKKYFIQLSSGTSSSIKFIDGFIDHTANIEYFIKYLCEEWMGIWDFIVNQSHYPEKKVEQYFKLIIEYAQVKDIKKIFSNSIKQISNNEYFLSGIKNEGKLKKIIKELEIKFKTIDLSLSEELINYIYINNCYQINIENVKFFSNKFMDADSYKDILEDASNFETRNYSTIKLSRLDNLINYIDDNIDEYIRSVYLKIDTNTEEESEYYIQLLNNDNILENNKIKIIQQVATQISDISKIEDLSMIKHLLNKSKMLATWGNLIKIYVQCEKEFIPEITAFMNFLENAKKLSNTKININVDNEETIKSFLKSLLLNDHVETVNYSYILSSIPYIYNSLSFENLSFEKVELLISKGILSTNTTNFELLEHGFKNLHILLIENNPDKFLEEIDSFKIENNNLLDILVSNSLSIQVKERIIKKYDKVIFTQDSKLLTQIGGLLLENINMNVDREIVLGVGIKSNLGAKDKIRLFNRWHRIYQEQDISSLLNSLGKPYATIAENGKRPLLEDNELNRELAENLELKKYISKFDIRRKGIRIFTFRTST